jgi:hypothetical protein
MYHIQDLLLTRADSCCAYRCGRWLGDFHLFSKCAKRESCYWDLRYLWVVWQMCVVCWHFQVCMCVCVCVCAPEYSDDTLSFCSWYPCSAHIVCVDRMRGGRAVRRNLQRTHCCCGASAKLMGILRSTFRTSQVWRQKAYYSHKFVLLCEFDVLVFCVCRFMA